MSLTKLLIESSVKQPVFNQTCLGRNISDKTLKAFSLIYALQISGTDHTVLSGSDLNKPSMLLRCHRQSHALNKEIFIPLVSSLWSCKARKIGTKPFVT